MPKPLDLSGQKFYRLTVLDLANKDGRIQRRYHCRCDCGNLTIVNTNNLRRGITKSCGCLAIEMKTKHGCARKKSGKIKSAGYYVWKAMMYRCYNPKAKAYPNYGGRGLIVSKEWHNPKKFLEDMGEPPQGMSIDRINNDKGYSKENCRWATAEVQNRNRRPKNLFRGIRINQTGTFSADIKVGSKYIRLGTFPTIMGAIEAYNEASRKYFGENGYINEYL